MFNWGTCGICVGRRALRGRRRGLTQADLALRMGVAPGTIAAWVHHSRRKLEALLL